MTGSAFEGQVVFHAGEHEVFSKDAFQDQVGKTIPVRWGNYETTGLVVGAKVDPDGKTATITYRVSYLG